MCFSLLFFFSVKSACQDDSNAKLLLRSSRMQKSLNDRGGQGRTGEENNRGAGLRAYPSSYITWIKKREDGEEEDILICDSKLYWLGGTSGPECCIHGREQAVERRARNGWALSVAISSDRFNEVHNEIHGAPYCTRPLPGLGRGGLHVLLPPESDHLCMRDNSTGSMTQLGARIVTDPNLSVSAGWKNLGPFVIVIETGWWTIWSLSWRQVVCVQKKVLVFFFFPIKSDLNLCIIVAYINNMNNGFCRM